MIEQDLARLGYDTGPVDGEETLETTIAISKFQAGKRAGDYGRGLTGTCESTHGGAAWRVLHQRRPRRQRHRPKRLPAIRQRCRQRNRPACRKRVAAAAQAAQKKKRGLGRLLNAAVRTATRSGGL